MSSLNNPRNNINTRHTILRNTVEDDTEQTDNEISCFSFVISECIPCFPKQIVQYFVLITTIIFAASISAGILMMFLGARLYNGWWMIFSFIFVFFAIVPDIIFNRISNAKSNNESNRTFRIRSMIRDICFIISGFCWFSSFAIILVFSHVGVISIKSMAMGISSVIVIFTAFALYMKTIENGKYIKRITCFSDVTQNDDDTDHVIDTI